MLALAQIQILIGLHPGQSGDGERQHITILMSLELQICSQDQTAGDEETEINKEIEYQ